MSILRFGVKSHFSYFLERYFYRMGRFFRQEQLCRKGSSAQQNQYPQERKEFFQIFGAAEQFFHLVVVVLNFLLVIIPFFLEGTVSDEERERGYFCDHKTIGVGRILAIDYGRKRVGLAVTDPCGIIATGLKTVRAHEVLTFLQQYLTQEKVDMFVVGHPKQMDNTDSESMVYIKPFLVALKRKFPEIPIEMYDERFTSVIAHKALIEGGAKKKTRQDKALIDTMSATIILTSYMESRRTITDRMKPEI